MFKRLESHPDSIEIVIEVDAEPVRVPSGISVAAALWLCGFIPSRLSAVGQSPRAPYCMMGVCFECRVEIDGVAGRQACMVPVAQGMQIRRTLHGAEPKR